MLCEHCQQHQATVHYTQVINGARTEMNLCAACAQIQGGFALGGVNMLLSGMLDNDAPRAATLASCDRCGLTYEEFRRTGMLGCAQCYDDFREQLTPVLRRIHGRLQHAGHAPDAPPTEKAGEISEDVARMQHIDTLRRDLQSAIDQEEFERAAQLRDALRELTTVKGE